jgi:acetyl esterase/lipase
VQFTSIVLTATKSAIPPFVPVIVSDSPPQLSTEPPVFDLWPEGVPGLRSDASEERIQAGRVENVHRPTLTLYAPAPGTANGAAVIYCPGGGYARLAVGEGGGLTTRWLLRLGITVFVLKYRLAAYGHPAPLRDVTRALRFVRSKAAEFHLRPDRVGVGGSSAGGHLSACACTLWDSPEGKTGSAALDQVCARPDFGLLIYPVITMRDPFAHADSRAALLGGSPPREAVDQLSVETQVRADTPPVFLAATAADNVVRVENTLLFYHALLAAGVPAELHLYAQGAHGDSHDPAYGPTARWPERAEEWLRFNGWIPASISPAARAHPAARA